jgi:hypothetical protein
VTLPDQGARGQAQVMNTKTLMIYGTGRGGGVPGSDPMLYAVDKATGKQIGAVKLESRTTAIPMTYMHRGRQYILFATGQEDEAGMTALVLPKK